MTAYPFNLDNVDISWKECLQQAITHIEPAYLKTLMQSTNWLPGRDTIFNAFSLPIDQVHYVLFGESPYPRAESANGYAFWDAAVTDLWSPTGLSKKVNRATSLRNIIKMLLIADGALNNTATQEAIATINKTSLVKTNHEFFTNFIHHGFLLLNATPVLQAGGQPQKDARAWRPFLAHVLSYLMQHRPNVQFILFGRIANEIEQFIPATANHRLYAEHPYNLSFITNQDVIGFFRPLKLLMRHK
jgi:uracil-DNA glycosylase